MNKHDEFTHWRELRSQLVQTWNRVKDNFTELEDAGLVVHQPIHRHHEIVRKKSKQDALLHD
jgi:hypothetical protein